jgi:hypothetical protein
MEIIKHNNQNSPFRKYSLVVLYSNPEGLRAEDDYEHFVCRLTKGNWLRKILMRKLWNIPTIVINVLKKPRFAYFHRFYEIQAHFISIGYLGIYWEGSPIIDRDE